MSSSNLENLVKTNKLKKEPFSESEFNGLIKSGKTRLQDANKSNLAQESRFDLAYNAAHSLALAALRWHGYRPDNRYIVFQVLPYTLGVDTALWRVLDKCHNMRNLAEYEGYLDIDELLLNDLLAATKTLLGCVKNLPVKL